METPRSAGGAGTPDRMRSSGGSVTAPSRSTRPGIRCKAYLLGMPHGTGLEQSTHRTPDGVAPGKASRRRKAALFGSFVFFFPGRSCDSSGSDSVGPDGVAYDNSPFGGVCGALARLSSRRGRCECCGGELRALCLPKASGISAPVAPTELLVVSGLYRYVRNPMYVGVLSVIVGQALVLGSTLLLEYAALIWLCFFAFVVLYEEPSLQRRFGAGYERYRTNVPRWCPRITPWR